jgi:hypothetical protein
VILGGGVSLFGQGGVFRPEAVQLKLVSSAPYANGVVLLTYDVA